MPRSVLEKEFNKKFGYWLKTKRVIAGFSQVKPATVLGVSFQQVQKYETGNNSITVFKLLELLKMYKISLTSFQSEVIEQSNPVIEASNPIDIEFYGLVSKLKANHRLALYRLAKDLIKSENTQDQFKPKDEVMYNGLLYEIAYIEDDHVILREIESKQFSIYTSKLPVRVMSSQIKKIS